ncbi:MAG TPA: hypothetical protein VGR54_07700 [Nitrosopumilaceae archaeon]|nr:hypothetical protein [Nitrosopumilaceae archaeon]
MFPIITKNRKAISVVMTTLIILVASVVLGTGVVLYGTSLFQTGGQTQSIATQGVKLWVNATNSTNLAWGVAAIRNSGDVLVSVSTIQIRGASVPYSSWYVDTDPTRTSQNFQANFNYTTNDKTGYPKGTLASAPGYTLGTWAGTGTPCTQTFGTTLVIQEIWNSGTTSPLCLKAQSGPVGLTPGAKMIVYFKVPLGILSPVDSGSTVTANIFAGNVGGPQTVTVGNQ